MMNVYLRNQVAALFLLLPVTTAMVAFPMAAMAQPGALELRYLQISSDAGLNSGAQLVFTAEGTPGAQAHLRIDGVSRDIALKETSRGIYIGSYTLMRQDAVSQSSALHVTLQDGERNAVANYAFPPGMGSTLPKAQVPQPDTQPDTQSERAADKLRIERFTVAPVKQIEPGAELRFAVSGPRGGSAYVQIPGLSDRVLLREVQAGVYEGGYTIRKQDKLIPSQPIVATLSQGKRFVKSRQFNTWVTNTKSPVRYAEPCEPVTPKVFKMSKPSRPAKQLIVKADSPKMLKASMQTPPKVSSSKSSRSSSHAAAKASTSKASAKASARAPAAKSSSRSGAKSSSTTKSKPMRT